MQINEIRGERPIVNKRRGIVASVLAPPPGNFLDIAGQATVTFAGIRLVLGTVVINGGGSFVATSAGGRTTVVSAATPRRMNIYGEPPVHNHRRVPPDIYERNILAALTIGGGATATFTGSLIQLGELDIDGLATAVFNGTQTQHILANMNGVGSMVATSGGTLIGGSTMNGKGATTFRGRGSFLGVITIAGTGTFACFGVDTPPTQWLAATPKQNYIWTERMLVQHRKVPPDIYTRDNNAELIINGQCTVTFTGSGTEHVFGTLECDGTSTAVFDGFMAGGTLIGDVECDGHAIVSFKGSLTLAGMWEADGVCTAMFIGGSGAVLISCLVNGNTPGSSPSPAAAFLFDPASSY